jgi:hypothetical protein
MRFKREEAHEFLKYQKGVNRLLRNYLEDLTCNPGTSRIEVNLIRYPFREFSWLFTCILSLETTMSVTRNVIYAIHYALHEKTIINWGYLISNEISF